MATTMRYTFSQLEQLWIQAGGSSKYAPMAAAVALAESGGRPDAVNTSNSNGTIDRGLWQINSIHGSQSTLDPVANARAAVAISKGGTDWRPWCTAWSDGRCGGSFMGTGAPVFKFLPNGATVSGTVPTGGSSTTNTSGTGNPVVLTSVTTDLLSWFANSLGITDAVKALFKYLGWVLLSLGGIFLMVFGFAVMIISSTRTGRGVASLVGSTTVTTRTQQRLGAAPDYSKPPPESWFGPIRNPDAPIPDASPVEGSPPPQPRYKPRHQQREPGAKRTRASVSVNKNQPEGKHKAP